MKGVALLCDVSAFQAGDAAYVVKNRLKACHIKEKRFLYTPRTP